MPNPFTVRSLCEGLGAPEKVVDFTDTPGSEVIFGAGAVSQVGEIARRLGGSRALLVTDPGIAKAGHAEWVSSYLGRAGLEVVLFDDVHENPTTADVARCVEAARVGEIDLIIGLGGGSSMDTAKGSNFILSNGGEMKDYWGVGKATKEMLPLIAIPTTAGTGSECQSFALIADVETHMKMACGDKKAAAKVAILDPELTLTQPALVTAHTGIDALTHAIETAVTSKRTATSGAYSKLAFSLLERGFERVIKSPGDLEARALMQLGAAYAGTAIENSMLGAAHAAANPVTAKFNVVHGESVGLMLPHVIRFNAEDHASAEIYADLAGSGERLVTMVRDWLELAGMPTTLSSYGIASANIAELARGAAAQWTAGFNPRPVAAEDFERLYAAAL
jgi:alcohol dehydrogenase